MIKPQTAQFVAGRIKSPGYRAGRALNVALLPADDPALRETTPQTVSSLTLDDVKQYYAKAVRPDLTTIVVIGDITPEEARSVIEKWFGAWKAVGPKPAVDLPACPPNKSSAANVPDPSELQDSVNLSEMVAITRFDPDYYPLQLANHVLGGGFYATRLYHDLRQVNGYVYDVDVRLTAGKTRSFYTVTYACDPQNVSKARELIQRDLISMQKENVTPAELQQAKALLLRQIPLAESSEDSVAGGLLARAQIGLPLDEPLRAGKQYFSMTADQVRDSLRKMGSSRWLRADHSRAGAAISLAQVYSRTEIYRRSGLGVYHSERRSMSMSMKLIRNIALFALCAICVPFSRADEGMWLFNNPPYKILQDKYHFQPSAAWLEHLQKVLGAV